MGWASDVMHKFVVRLPVLVVVIGVLVYGPRVPMDIEFPSEHGKLHLMPLGMRVLDL